MTVKQLPEKTWFFRFQCGKQEYREQGFRTRLEAERAEAREKSELLRLESAGQGYNRNLKLHEVADLFFEERSLGQKKTWKSDRARLTTIKTYFGERRIREISPRDVESFRRYVLKTAHGRDGSQVSLHTVNHYHALLKAVINWAKKKRLYGGENPAWGVEMAKVEKARVRFLLPEEEKRLTPVVAKNTRLWPYYVIALHTGMRLGEICAIRAKDVMLHPEPMLFVPHTKSKCSRYVPLSETAAQILVERSKKALPEMRLLEPVNQDTVSSSWFKDACEEAQIQDNFTFHCLRHTFAAHMLGRGVPIYKVSKIMGHSGVGVTEQHYGHLDRSTLSQEIHHVNGVISLPSVLESSVVVNPVVKFTTAG
ncbi:MAG TPA: site-specific integrase [Elusimicrobiota bacterium]|nr:site-specific integrase [Elusimicrobiota bacterium]